MVNQISDQIPVSSGRSDGLDQNAINADPAGFANWQQQKNMQPQTSSGKGGGGGLQQGGQMQGGAVTFPGQDGQPQMGMPNAYSNTIGTGQQLLDSQGSWDNSPKPSGKGSAGSSGKGKGA